MEMPMRILFLLPCFFFLPALAASQCCCCLKRDAGQTAYNNGKYETAIAKWQDAKKCSDAASCTNLDSLIANAHKKIKPPAPAKQRQQQAAAEQKRLADKADDDTWYIVKDSKDTSMIKKYLEKYPQGRHESEAKQKLKELTPIALPYEPEMVFIQGGTFLMGSTDINDEDDPPVPVHTVNVGDFYLGKYEVTNREYCAFLNLNEKGNQTEGGDVWITLGGGFKDEKCRIRQTNNVFNVESGYENYPVLYISWYGAKAYANWLSAKTGKKYRLPTESEWEYAAGNGSRHTKYSWGNGAPYGKQGDNIDDETFKKTFPNVTTIKFTGYTDTYAYTAPVGSFNANDLGLHDMGGNVREWCEDVYHRSYRGAPTDGSAWLDGGYRTEHVSRGGDWSSERPVASRSIYHAASMFGYYGFRVAQDK